MQARNSSQLPVSSSQSANDESGIHWRLTTGNRQLLQKTKRPPGNLGGLFFSRENSSNGGFIHQNFLPKSYES
jgi:hypothetical protein